MADQKKWFKLWTSICSDDDFDPSDSGLLRLGRFCLLGAYVALHGDKGSVSIAENTLLRMMQIDSIEQLQSEFNSKNISFKKCVNRHGKVSVTYHKWVKYQLDSTMAERQSTSRAKRRGEERRGEEIREEKKEEEKKEKETCGAKVKPSSTSAAKMPDSEWLNSLKQNPAYKRIDVDTLYNKMLAWCELKGKKPTKARLLNWLNREEVPLNGQKMSAWEQIMEDEYGSEGSGQGALIPANRLP